MRDVCTGLGKHPAPASTLRPTPCTTAAWQAAVSAAKVRRGSPLQPRRAHVTACTGRPRAYHGGSICQLGEVCQQLLLLGAQRTDLRLQLVHQARLLAELRLRLLLGSQLLLQLLHASLVQSLHLLPQHVSMLEAIWGMAAQGWWPRGSHEIATDN